MDDEYDDDSSTGSIPPAPRDPAGDPLDFLVEDMPWRKGEPRYDTWLNSLQNRLRSTTAAGSLHFDHHRGTAFTLRERWVRWTRHYTYFGQTSTARNVLRLLLEVSHAIHIRFQNLRTKMLKSHPHRERGAPSDRPHPHPTCPIGQEARSLACDLKVLAWDMLYYFRDGVDTSPYLEFEQDFNAGDILSSAVVGCAKEAYETEWTPDDIGLQLPESLSEWSEYFHQVKTSSQSPNAADPGLRLYDDDNLYPYVARWHTPAFGVTTTDFADRVLLRLRVEHNIKEG